MASTAAAAESESFKNSPQPLKLTDASLLSWETYLDAIPDRYKGPNAESARNVEILNALVAGPYGPEGDGVGLIALAEQGAPGAGEFLQLILDFLSSAQGDDSEPFNDNFLVAVFKIAEALGGSGGTPLTEAEADELMDFFAAVTDPASDDGAGISSDELDALDSVIMDVTGSPSAGVPEDDSSALLPLSPASTSQSSETPVAAPPGTATPVPAPATGETPAVPAPAPQTPGTPSPAPSPAPTPTAEAPPQTATPPSPATTPAPAEGDAPAVPTPGPQTPETPSPAPPPPAESPDAITPTTAEEEVEPSHGNGEGSILGQTYSKKDLISESINTTTIKPGESRTINLGGGMRLVVSNENATASDETRRFTMTGPGGKVLFDQVVAVPRGTKISVNAGVEWAFRPAIAKFSGSKEEGNLNLDLNGQVMVRPYVEIVFESSPAASTRTGGSKHFNMKLRLQQEFNVTLGAGTTFDPDNDSWMVGLGTATDSRVDLRFGVQGSAKKPRGPVGDDGPKVKPGDPDGPKVELWIRGFPMTGAGGVIDLTAGTITGTAGAPAFSPQLVVIVSTKEWVVEEKPNETSAQKFFRKATEVLFGGTTPLVAALVAIVNGGYVGPETDTTTTRLYGSDPAVEDPLTSSPPQPEPTGDAPAPSASLEETAPVGVVAEPVPTGSSDGDSVEISVGDVADSFSIPDDAQDVAGSMFDAFSQAVESEAGQAVGSLTSMLDSSRSAIDGFNASSDVTEWLGLGVAPEINVDWNAVEDKTIEYSFDAMTEEEKLSLLAYADDPVEFAAQLTALFLKHLPAAFLRALSEETNIEPGTLEKLLAAFAVPDGGSPVDSVPAPVEAPTTSILRPTDWDTRYVGNADDNVAAPDEGLTRSEWFQALLGEGAETTAVAAATPGLSDQAFSSYDQNGDGVLSDSEVEAMITDGVLVTQADGSWVFDATKVPLPATSALDALANGYQPPEQQSPATPAPAAAPPQDGPAPATPVPAPVPAPEPAPVPVQDGPPPAVAAPAPQPVVAPALPTYTEADLASAFGPMNARLLIGVYDRDNSGALDDSEQRAAIADGVLVHDDATGWSINPGNLENQLSDFGDQNGSLSFDEFNAIRGIMGLAPLTLEQFKLLDFNGDGVTSQAEFNQAGWYFGEGGGMNQEQFYGMLQTLGIPVPPEGDLETGTWWEGAAGATGVVGEDAMSSVSVFSAFTSPAEEESVGMDDVGDFLNDAFNPFS